MNLTSRQAAVLQAVADGCSTRQAAYRLGVSPFTVRRHLATVYQRLQANDRCHAVAIALREGAIR